MNAPGSFTLGFLPGQRNVPAKILLGLAQQTITV
jgi:hypothetical protein